MTAPDQTTNSVEAIIRQGRHRLSVLQHQLLAARLAADSIDLETAIQAAENGNAVPLKQWLAQHDTSHPSIGPTAPQPLQIPDLVLPSRAFQSDSVRQEKAPTPATEPTFTPAIMSPISESTGLGDTTHWTKPAPDATAENQAPVQISKEQPAPDAATIHPLWQSILAGAIERQQSSGASLDKVTASTTVQSSSDANEQAAAASSKEDGVAAKTISRDQPATAIKPTKDVAKPDAKQSVKPRKATKPQRSSSTKSRSRPDKTLAPTNSATVVKKRQAIIVAPELRPATQVVAQQNTGWLSWLPKHLPLVGKRQKTPSWVVSLVVHIIILLALMSFTLDTQQLKNILAINATAGSVEVPTFELPMEMPLEPSPEPMEMDVPDFSPSAEALSTSNLDTSVSDLLSDMGSVSISAETGAPNLSSGGGAPTIPSPQANFFGVEATGNTFGYLVDNSPSMKQDNAFASAKAELIRSLSQLKSNQRYYIIFFSDSVELMTLDPKLGPEDHPVYATPENLAATKRWIESVAVSSNGAPPNDALKAAIDLDLDAAYMLTDGVTSADVCGFLKRNNFVEDFINGKQLRTAIHTLGFFSQKGETLLKQIAKENGGQYLYIPKPPKR